RDRGLRRPQAGPEEVDHRHEAPLHGVPAALHGPRHDHVPGRSAGDRDGQGGLSALELPGRWRRTPPVRRTLRRILSWKFVFYELLLPALRGLGPAWGDRILGWLGRGAVAIQPRRRSRLRAALHRASAALE